MQQDELSAHNRILIALQGIGWMTAQIEHARVQLDMLDLPVPEKLAAEHEAFLGKIGMALHALMDEVGDYQNNCDMVAEKDEYLMTPLFDVLRGPINAD